ncbi:MAG: glycosyltransferase family 39 protein [Planctomycetota bacterium]
MSGDRAIPLVVLALAAAALFPLLGLRDHLSSAEARGPLVAREMIATGEFLPPRLLGERYLNKPPLFHALVAGSFLALGESDAAARVPSVLAALGAILVTFLLGRSVAGPRAGAAAALFLAGTSLFFYQARSAEMETLLTLGVALSYLGVADAAAAGRFRRRAFALIAAGAFVATLTKGPVLALLFPAFALAGSAIAHRSRRGLGLGAAAILLGTALATLAYYGPLAAESGLRELLRERLLMENVRHDRPFWYYLAKLPLLAAPSAVFLLGSRNAITTGWRRAGGWLVGFGLGVLVFSLSSSKQSHYLLPLFPLLAVWGGAVIDAQLERGGRRGLFVIALLSLATLSAGPLLLDLGTEILQRSPALQVVGILALFVTMAATAVVWPRRRDQGPPVPARSALLVAAAALAALLVFDAAAGLVATRDRSPRRAAEMARRAHAADAEVAHPIVVWDANLVLCYYLGDTPFTREDDAVRARGRLDADANALLLASGKRKDPWPPAFAGLETLDEVESPDGDRRWVLFRTPRTEENR